MNTFATKNSPLTAFAWLDNLRLALEWALQTNIESELRLASAMMWFWHIRSRWSEGIDWLERGLADVLPRLGDGGLEKHLTSIHAKALSTLGFSYLMTYIFRGKNLSKAKNVLTASISL